MLLSSTSEMFLSVSFLFSSIFLSMPTIPTARVLPAYRTTKERKTQEIQALVTDTEGEGKTNNEEGTYCRQLLVENIHSF